MIINCYCTKEFAVYRRSAFSIIRLISPSLTLSLSHKGYLLHCSTLFHLLLLPVRESTLYNRWVNFSVMFRWYLKKVRRDIVDRTPPNSTPQCRLGGTSYWASVSFPTNSHFPSSLFFSATHTSSHHMDDDQDAYNAQQDDAPWPHDPNVFTESHGTLPVYLLVCSPDVTKAKKLTHCAFNTLVTCR